MLTLPGRRREAATFVLLVVLTEVAGRSATTRVDRALHVAPLAPASASYYPFVLVAIKILAALVVAALLARGIRAHASADAGRHLLDRVGHAGRRSAPRLQVGLSARAWFTSFAGTSLAYLIWADADVDSATNGRWPLLGPWLHTYALPVFAALSVLVALVWSVLRWLSAVEEFGVRAIAHARRIMRAALQRERPRHALPVDDIGPRRRFGLAFESRPPPLPA